jgi:ABC-type transport system involved in cytochrome bd biosynthesis fused ATPase/permease subunit
MKADLVSLDAARAAREQVSAREPSRKSAERPDRATAILIGASLAMIACGIVSAMLWLAWKLAEIVP